MTTDGSAKSRWWITAAAAVPNLLVNATAFSAQYSFFRSHLHWISPGQVMAALALESIAVYLAFHAHVAQLANDSAFRLKAGSYGMGAVIAAINYSHYAGPNWRPTVIAVVMALMSGSSPWLWSIHSRRASRDKLLERGLLDEHAVRLGATRWTWHPILSVRVMRRATWIGETDPKRAIRTVQTKFAELPDLAVAGLLGTLDPVQLAQVLMRAIEGAQPVLDSAPETVPGDDEPPAGEPPSGGTPPAGPPVAPPADGFEISVPGEPPVAVPAVSVPLSAVPDAVPEAVPAPAVASASANLTADATMPRRNNHPPQEVIDAAEEALFGMPDDKLPSERRVAEELLHDPQQRRLAKKLLIARRAGGTQRLQAPPGETVNGSASDNGRRRVQPGERVIISSPVKFEPGGGVSG